IDETTQSAWAVVNVNGRFAVGTVEDEPVDTVVAVDNQTADHMNTNIVMVQGNNLIFPIPGKMAVVRAEIFNLNGKLTEIVSGSGPVMSFNKKLNGVYIVKWNSGNLNGIQKVIIK
ncbi:MAG: T9SS type A sorting domain-containing protein, partial [Fibrobacteria bacterium]|nr:T9SS type A sorting domain-containing protein [Fibrobacteria bacterium]